MVRSWPVAAMGGGTVGLGSKYRFGLFEVDTGSKETFKGGMKMRLRGQPYLILEVLLARAGQVVTREEIREKLWPSTTFVDFEHGLNTSVKKLRQALCDSADNPRYIETLPRLGYRFIAQVEVVTFSEAAPEVKSALEAPVLPPSSVAPDSPLPEQSWGSRHSRLLLWLMLLGMAIAVVALGIRFELFRSEVRPSRTGGRTMLAVLPFENLTGDGSQEYFSDGMTEEMIAQLGSLDPGQMGVIARTSAMHYKHTQEPLPQIARDLGVDYVLEGSVRRDADKIRITAQLIQIRDQTHLWARQYDRAATDVLVLQNEIARSISSEIQKSLGEHRPVPATTQPVLSPQALEAYSLYLKGQYFWNKRTGEGFQQAIHSFQQAIEKDPDDAQAYAGLASSYALWGPYTGSPAAGYAREARAAALRAVELNDKLPEAHAALALIIQNHDYDWRGAEKEFKRAIELNPNYATAHHWYAEHLAWQGRFEEAFRESERARQLDPLSLIIASDYAALLYYSRQYDRAIAQFKAVREMDPDFARAGLIFGPYVQQGKFPEAEAAIQSEGPDDGRWYPSNRAYVYGREGRHKQAEEEIRELLEANSRQPMDPIVLVQAYVGAGDKQPALAWLEKAYEQHSNGLTGLKVDPMFDPLRGDPRFQNILERVGLAQ